MVLGVYGQDAWRASDRLTLNLGLRWEPYFGTVSKNGAISNFVLDNFNKGIKEHRVRERASWTHLPGDPGFPQGKTGLKQAVAERGSLASGAAWDVTGSGRLSRSARRMAINYERPTAIFQQVPASGAPFGNRLTLTGNIPFDDPCTATCPAASCCRCRCRRRETSCSRVSDRMRPIDPNINSTRVQSWNVTAERQLGAVVAGRRELPRAPTWIASGDRTR